MHPLIEQIDRLFLSDLGRIASDMQKRFPGFKFSAWHGPTGDLTEYQGYDLGVECIFPQAGLDAPDNVALTVSVCHLASRPRVMAEVVWGHPSGLSEKSFREGRHSNAEWPEATPEILEELVEAYPKFVKTFELAVENAARTRRLAR